MVAMVLCEKKGDQRRSFGVNKKYIVPLTTRANMKIYDVHLLFCSRNMQTVEHAINGT
jgi:hypothetical protein